MNAEHETIWFHFQEPNSRTARRRSFRTSLFKKWDKDAESAAIRDLDSKVRSLGFTPMEFRGMKRETVCPPEMLAADSK